MVVPVQYEMHVSQLSYNRPTDMSRRFSVVCHICWQNHWLSQLIGTLLVDIYITTYIAPLQGNYSEALPAQARPKRRVLRSFIL